MIRDSIKKLNRPHWSGLVNRVEKIEAGYINLDRNENQDEILCGHIQKAIKHFLDLSSSMKYEDYYRYYEMFADYYNTTLDNILITCGCDEAIRLTFEATLDETSKFLTITPTYRGAMTNAVDLTSNIFECSENEDDILEAIEKHSPNVFYICSPNNPSGKVYSAKFIDYICGAYPNMTVLIDNTYRHFCTESYFDLCKYENCLLAFSYSKSWGLAGARLGILQGHKNTIEQITKIRPIMGVSSITLRLAEYLHKHHYIVDKSLERNKEGIEFAYKYLSNCKIYSEPTINHVVFEPTEEIINRLDSQKILYGKQPEYSSTAIRLTTLPKDQFEKLLCLNTYN